MFGGVAERFMTETLLTRRLANFMIGPFPLALRTKFVRNDADL